MKKILIGLALFFFASALAFAGETLAEAAKKEKERRAKITKPAKVITNKDVEDFKASGKVVGGTIESATEGEGEGEEATTATEDADALAKEDEKAEAEFKAQIADAQAKVQAAQDRVKQLDARAKSNMYNTGIDQLTGKGAADADELKQAQQDLQDAQDELEKVQTQARNSGVYLPR